MTGWVEILPGPDADSRFIVMDWNEHRDSGEVVGGYPCRWLAEIEAWHHAATLGRKMVSADIIPFPVPEVREDA